MSDLNKIVMALEADKNIIDSDKGKIIIDSTNVPTTQKKKGKIF